jgi:ribosomal protein L12E/L44/L45/RPP1/RPP2
VACCNWIHQHNTASAAAAAAAAETTNSRNNKQQQQQQQQEKQKHIITRELNEQQYAFSRLLRVQSLNSADNG